MLSLLAEMRAVPLRRVTAVVRASQLRRISTSPHLCDTNDRAHTAEDSSVPGEDTIAVPSVKSASLEPTSGDDRGADHIREHGETVSRDMGAEAESSSRARAARETPSEVTAAWNELYSSIPASLPSRNPRANPIFRRAEQNFADSPRLLKGSQNREQRGKGQTPQEAKAFDTILREMQRDLVANNFPNIQGKSLDHLTRDPYTASTANRPKLPYWSRERERAAVDEEDLELARQVDELREELSVCTTDREVLDWAETRVFAPLPTDAGGEGERNIVFAKTYPQILGYLLRVVRTNYNNPHLTLALFRYAQSHSLESYLQGCLFPAYNEMLKCRWEAFKDLQGVEEGIKEMELNGVAWDRETQVLVGRIVEQVGKEMLGGEKKWGMAVYDRLARLEERLEVDIREQERRYIVQQRAKSNARREIFQAGLPRGRRDEGAGMRT
ncbi:hypothetical protein P7C73_g547, partial [Tremellales sp. Uapishka_1]